jgi:hypothetical protein
MLTFLLLRLFFMGVIGDAPTAKAVVRDPVQAEQVEAPRVAQVRLAETLASADAIHAVRARAGKVTFVITRGDAIVHLVATTKKGDVVALSIVPAKPIGTELGGLSWLADELESTTAITRLVADADGAVTITTSDGRRYMAIPGRGSGGGGNDAVEARWAAEWNR